MTWVSLHGQVRDLQTKISLLERKVEDQRREFREETARLHKLHQSQVGFSPLCFLSWLVPRKWSLVIILWLDPSAQLDHVSSSLQSQSQGLQWLEALLENAEKEGVCVSTWFVSLSACSFS